MPYYITSSRTKDIYEQPAFTAPLLKQAKPYDYLTVLESRASAEPKLGVRKTWIHIRTHDDIEGYTSGTYMRALFERLTPVEVVPNIDFLGGLVTRLIDNTNAFRAGRAGKSISGVVLHTSGIRKTDKDDYSLFNGFNRKDREDSAHYFVKFSGVIEQYVKDEDTAYHAGDLSLNRMTIGIEHMDSGYYETGERYTDKLYEASAQLIETVN